MAEAKWLACAGVGALIGVLLKERRPLSIRKLRLAASAISRRVLHLLPHRKFLRAITAAEKRADGRLERMTRNEVKRALADVFRGRSHRDLPAEAAVARAFHLEATYDVTNAASYVLAALEKQPHDGQPFDQWAERRHHADLFRDVYPRRPLDRLPPSIRDWDEDTPSRLALEAYECQSEPLGHLDNGRLAVLSDALEEAGCSDATLLGHLRSPSVHVRGCWAVDLVLDRP
jgi:hypothetical protein